jgi:hypothetical protein
MFPNLNISSTVYLVLYLVVAFGALYEPFAPYKPKKKLQYFALFIFVLLSGLRITGDTPTYRMYYNDVLDIRELEFGYQLVNVFFRLLHFDFPLFLLSIAVITGLLIKKSFGEKWFFFAMLMILGKLATLYAFSGIRQWIALCICFYAIYLLLKGHRLYFLIAVFVAFQFHRSAMILFPMVLFYNRAFKYRIAFITIFVAILIGLSSKEFFQAAADLNPAFDFGGYLREGEESMNAFNWVENFAILIPAVLFRHKLIRKVPNYDFFLYMHLIYCSFLIAGSDFGIIKRLRDYYVTGYYVLLPAFQYLFSKKTRKYYLLLVVFYFGLLFFRSLNFYYDVGQYKCVLFDRLV